MAERQSILGRGFALFCALIEYETNGRLKRRTGACNRKMGQGTSPHGSHPVILSQWLQRDSGHHSETESDNEAKSCIFYNRCEDGEAYCKSDDHTEQVKNGFFNDGFVHEYHSTENRFFSGEFQSTPTIQPALFKTNKI